MVCTLLGSTRLRDGGQPIVVRSNPSLCGETSQLRRLTPKFKLPIVVGLESGFAFSGVGPEGKVQPVTAEGDWRRTLGGMWSNVRHG
jgi:hypothetical protein